LEINKLARLEIENEEKRRREGEVAPAPLEKTKAWKTKFHLSNLNEDPLLTGKIRHIFNEGTNVIGKSDPAGNPEIVIGGAGIFKNHCKINFDGKTAELIPNSTPSIAKVFVNGKLLEEPIALAHNDRILFGVHNYFVFNDPSKPEDSKINWEYANEEVVGDQIKAMTLEQDEILKQKQKELEEKYEADKTKSEAEAKGKLEERLKEIEEKKAILGKEYEEKLQQLNNKGGSKEEIAKLKEEMEKAKSEHNEHVKELKERAEKSANRASNKQREIKEQMEYRLKVQKELEQNLTQVIPKINEVNQMCLQLGKLEYLYKPTITTEIKDSKMKPKICIKIFPDRVHQNVFNLVDFNEFIERYYMIQEKFQNYQYDMEHNEFIKFEENKEEDEKVFGVGIKNDWRFIGQAHIYTDVIANLIDIKEDYTPLIDNKGNVKGHLKYSIILKLLNEGQEEGLLMYGSIEDIENKILRIKLIIHGARGLPPNFIDQLICRYKWIDEKKEDFETPVITIRNTNPEINYEKVHELLVSSYIISHISEASLAIGVYNKMLQDGVVAQKKGIEDYRARSSDETEDREIEEPVTSNDPLVLKRELEL